MFTRLAGAASLAAAAALPLVLSACGSSGSGQMSLQREVAGNHTALAAARAAENEPRPGSVTQSSNAADRIEVSDFDPANNSFTITNTAPGAGWTIGTGNARPLNGGGAGDAIWLAQQVDGGRRVVFAYPRAAEEGGTDWLAAGIWTFVPDSEEPGDYEFGAFAYGNDPFEQDNLQALTGTAEYEGQAVGVYYAFSTSTDESEAGPFTADVALEANFGTAEALGSISGTVSDVETQDGTAIGATLNLGSADIGSSNAGFFTGSTNMTFGGRTYAGSWGGQFFDDGAAATDHPASVAGTFGATVREAGGTGSLVGAFGAERTAQ